MAKAFAVVEYDEKSVAPPSYDKPVTWFEKDYFHSSLLKVTTDVQEMSELRKARHSISSSLSYATAFMAANLVNCMVYDDQPRDYYVEWAIEAAQSAGEVELSVIEAEIQQIIFDAAALDYDSENEEKFLKGIHKAFPPGNKVLLMLQRAYDMYDAERP